ncbi:hypothetical protein BDAP_001979 [Binucleata daphniae]
MGDSEKAKNLLESDLADDEPDFITQSIPSFLQIVLSTILTGVFIFLTAFFLVMYASTYDLSVLQQKVQYIGFTIGFYLSSALTIWFIVDITLVVIALYYQNEESNFLTLAILYNRFAIKLALTMLIFSFCMHMIVGLKEPKDELSEDTIVNVTEQKDADEELKKENEQKKTEETRKIFEKTPFEIKEKQLSQFLLAFSLFFFVILLKRILLHYVNYQIHYKHYKDRIDENKKRIDYLLMLNKIVEKKMTNDLKLWSGKVFSKIVRNETTYLTIDDFVYYFGEEDGENMFMLFDENRDNNVTKDEFIHCYIGLYKEKKMLKTSLNENDQALKKLELIFMLIFYPVAFFLAFVVLGQSSLFKNLLSGFLGIFLPATFIFGSVLADMFQSIIFIFNVRPFDIGDCISVNGKTYIVHEMGLLYSTLLSDSRFHNFPNETLRKTPVINLRQSIWITEEFEQTYDYESCKDKLDELRAEIKQFLKKNKKQYKQDFNVGEFVFTKGNAVKIKITVKLACPYQDIKGASDRKDRFTLFLHETLNRLSIVRL